MAKMHFGRHHFCVFLLNLGIANHIMLQTMAGVHGQWDGEDTLEDGENSDSDSVSQLRPLPSLPLFLHIRICICFFTATVIFVLCIWLLLRHRCVLKSAL